jgi:hypothetical protein
MNQSLFQLPKRNCRRDRFAVFVKILLQVLKESGDFALLDSVKQTILVCTRRNQAGDPNFTPLADTTSRLLQSIVGEAQWQRAEAVGLQVAMKKNAVFVQERAERRKFNEAVQQTYMANLSSLKLLQQRNPFVLDANVLCALLFTGQSAPWPSILGAAATQS